MNRLIHTNEHNVQKYYAGVIICSILSVSIYIWGFLSTSEEGSIFNCDVGFYYIFKCLYLAVFGVLGNLLYKNKVKTKYLGIAATGALILYCFIINNLFCYDYLYAIKELCLSLWPVFTYLFGSKIIRINRDKSKAQYILGMGIYFVLLIFVICFIENTLVPSEFYRRDSVEMIFMIVIGIVSWRIIEKQHCIEKSILELSMFSISSFLVTFWNHERILDIMSSLINPISSVPIDNLHTDNWIGYRMSLAWNAWFGDMSPFLDDTFYFNVNKCSLFWIKYQKGWLPALIILIMEITLLVCIVMLIKNKGAGKKALVKILLASVLLYTILGFLADIFLITSTDIGMLILRNPGDILLVFYFVFGESQIPVLLREEREAELGGSEDENVRYSYAHHSRGR